jgi:hypothetical protein
MLISFSLYTREDCSKNQSFDDDVIIFPFQLTLAQSEVISTG